jgi:hypothetical protein
MVTPSYVLAGTDNELPMLNLMDWRGCLGESDTDIFTIITILITIEEGRNWLPVIDAIHVENVAPIEDGRCFFVNLAACPK